MSLLLRRCRPVASGPAGPELVDVLLDGGRVASVLPAGALSPSSVTDELDLDGRWLLPGLWDEHVHLGQWALARQRLDVSGAGSAAAAAELVRRRAATTPGSGVLVGSGFRDGLWPDLPSAALLDAAVAGAQRPVVLVSGDLHCAWLSSAAAREVAAPLGAVPDAHGLVREEAAFAVQRALARSEEGGLDAAVAAALAEAASLGVVGVVDLEMTDADGGTAAVWAHRAATSGAAASAGLRVEAGTYPQHLDAAVAAGVRSGRPLARGSDLVVGGPLKVITDGSLNTRTACCLEPYPGRTGPGSRGELVWPVERLVPLLRRGTAAGLEPAVHAIGDGAVRVVLDALEQTDPLPGRTGAGRGRVEHAQLVDDDDVPRFAALGVTASAQPAHLLDDRDVAEVHWPGRTRRAFPLRALLDAGARLALGSDAPVAPLDPWLAMSAAVLRTDATADPRRPAWHPEQALTPTEALAASTRGRVGVAVGSAADVVVVDDDPLAAVAAGTRPHVWLVVVEGVLVHRSDLR